MIEPTSLRPDAATAIFNLPDYRVTETEVLAFGQRRIHVVATAEAAGPHLGMLGVVLHVLQHAHVRVVDREVTGLQVRLAGNPPDLGKIGRNRVSKRHSRRQRHSHSASVAGAIRSR